MEDEKIIELFFARSELAIKELDGKYGKVCHSISYNILNNNLDAEECVNDAYLGTWNAIPPQRPNPLLAFVCKIVRRYSIMRHRANTAMKRNDAYDVALAELEENHLFTSGNANSMAEVRDGRVYFTLDNSDITEYCSETTYFRYDFTDEQGISHVILIGGEVDAIAGEIDNTIGWTEILFLEDGRRLSHSNLVTEGNDPEWYVKGNAEVNEDYGYVPPQKEGNYSYEIEIEPEVVE